MRLCTVTGAAHTHLYVRSRRTSPSMAEFFRHISWQLALWNTKLHRHLTASTRIGVSKCGRCSVPMSAKLSSWLNCLAVIVSSTAYLFRDNIRMAHNVAAKKSDGLPKSVNGRSNSRNIPVQIFDHSPASNALKSNWLPCCEWCS